MKFGDFVQDNWASSQVLAEQNFNEGKENRASYYAGRAAAFREVIIHCGENTNEEIYRFKKLELKRIIEFNQVRKG